MKGSSSTELKEHEVFVEVIFHKQHILYLEVWDSKKNKSDVILSLTKLNT